jgi:hypothetical protein
MGTLNVGQHRVSRFTIRRHLRGRGPVPGHRLRSALRYDTEGRFRPVRRAERPAQRAQHHGWDAKARVERAARRAAERERSRLYTKPWSASSATCSTGAGQSGADVA